MPVLEASGTLIAARFGHTATLLRNGQVLVAGGFADRISHSTAELYDPATGTWRQTASFNTINVGDSAVLPPSGKVLVVGLSSANSMGAELYDSATETWSSTNAPSFRGAPGQLLGHDD